MLKTPKKFEKNGFDLVLEMVKMVIKVKNLDFFHFKNGKNGVIFCYCYGTNIFMGFSVLPTVREAYCMDYCYLDGFLT